MISISINLRLLDKSRFKTVTLKNGQEATFCELVLFESKNDKFGNDFFVKQNTSKEDRENGVQLPILGNGKIIKARSQNVAPDATRQESSQGGDSGGNDDVPFN